MGNSAPREKKFPKSLPRWALIVAAVLILDVFAIYLMFKLGGPDSQLEKLGYETIKLSIQLFLIVLFGGIFIQEYNRTRARKDAVNELRRTILKDLSRAYSDAKGVRRILRARCERSANNETTPPEDCIPLPLYDEHIGTINTTQLELEIMVRELKIIKGIFKNSNELIGDIKQMEEYLSGVITEYETNVKAHRGKVAICLSNVPRLRAMIKKTKEGSDFKRFSESYHDALTIIQE
jgi:hypothetical protein